MNFNQRYATEMYAIENEITPAEAERRLDWAREQRISRAEAKAKAARAAKADLAQATADEPITAKTKTAVEKIMQAPNKARRSEIQEILGDDRLWNFFANPQTRERVYAEMSEATGLRILRKL